MQGVWVWSLVGELGSHMPRGQGAKAWNRSNVVTGSMETLKMVHIKKKIKKKWTVFFIEVHFYFCELSEMILGNRHNPTLRQDCIPSRNILYGRRKMVWLLNLHPICLMKTGCPCCMVCNLLRNKQHHKKLTSLSTWIDPLISNISFRGGSPTLNQKGHTPEEVSIKHSN